MAVQKLPVLQRLGSTQLYSTNKAELQGSAALLGYSLLKWFFGYRLRVQLRHGLKR
jgi:hypothetical protein